VGRLVAGYEPGVRARLTVPPAAADDPAVLLAAARELPAPARRLLDLLWLAAPVGEPLPDRLRVAVERAGDPLWHALLLLPRASVWEEASIHPLHYAASCRLNPALADWRPDVASLPPADATPVFPNGDAWWEAVVVAAWLEANPATLTQDGVIRRDAERRLVTGLPGDPARWETALRLARLVGLVRPSGKRLYGFPEAPPRPLADPAALFVDPVQHALAAVLLRVIGPGWVSVGALEATLRGTARELVQSPKAGTYPSHPEIGFDDAGWARVEGPALHHVLEVLHRVGVFDLSAAPDPAVRRGTPRPALGSGFLLTPDLDLLVHAGDLRLADYGRLARLAPYREGERLHRHHLTREGLAADLAHGHLDAAAFLAEHSRTGLPPNVADTIRHWQRSATRVTVVSGVDLIEAEDGTLRLAPPGATAERVIDYSTPPRGRILYHKGELGVLDGWDPLTVRACVQRVARYDRREGDERRYQLERRVHARPLALVDQLRHWYGGDLPGEVELAVVAMSHDEPVHAEEAVVVHLPAPLAGALRRDRVVGPLLRRPLGLEQAVVARSDLAVLRARLDELGVRWD